MSGADRPWTRLKRRVGGRYRRAQRSLEHLLFERGLQSTSQPGVSSGHLFLFRGLSGCRIGRNDVFLDYGSGKGRVLLHAARRPFARVIGLELHESECEIARSNLEIAANRLRCREVDVICGDATVWRVPDDVTYIYMFNPFKGEIFKAVLDRVCESLDRRPRR